MDSAKQFVDAGAWIGRQQAFAVVGAKCSAAQALALKHTKESRVHEQLGLTWDEFCPRHAGLSRSHADELIRQLDEFGEAYFRLSEIARISPETYRRIAPQIEDGAIEIEGEKLAFTPENAARIRAAVLDLRAQLREARTAAPPPSSVIAEWQSRLNALLHDVRSKIYRPLPDADRTAIGELASYAVSKWSEIVREAERKR